MGLRLAPVWAPNDLTAAALPGRHFGDASSTTEQLIYVYVFFVEQAARWCGRSRFAPGRSVNLFRHTNYRLPIAVPAIRRKFVYDLTRRRIDAKHVALANY